MSWRPTRAGNWLFHCHMLDHMTPSSNTTHEHQDVRSHAGTAGLVVGVEVVDKKTAAEASAPPPPRRLSLVLTEEIDRYGTRPGYRAHIDLWLEVRRGNGEWVLQAPVHIR